MSTNPIESAFSVVRTKSSRVKNWKSGKAQMSRWAAAGLLEAEKNFRTIKGFQEIPSLKTKILNVTLAKKTKVA